MVPNRESNLILKAKRELEGAIDAIQDPVHVINRDFQIIRANRAFAAICDLNIREVSGRICYKTLFLRDTHCESCPLIRDDQGRAGSVAPDRTVELTTRDKVFNLNAYPFHSPDGDAAFVCYYRDVTREKHLKRQIVQSEKLAAVGQLAGGVAHEINNPLGVIFSFAQLATTRAAILNDEELVDDLSEILKAAERCKRIVRGLLDFSRPAKDEEIEPLVISRILEDSLFLVKTQFKKQRVTVEESYLPDLPRVLGNINKLQQVAVNLIQNAFQAVGDEGRLVLTTRTEGKDWVVMEVADNGYGIAPENLERIFEPFFSTKKIGTGTGLGLSISYGIVTEHNGRIEVFSTPGKGTTFQVFLPIHQES